MHFEVYRDESEENKWRWRLWFGNEENIANPGEGYEHKHECLQNIKLVKQSADAPVYDVDGTRLDTDGELLSITDAELQETITDKVLEGYRK